MKNLEVCRLELDVAVTPRAFGSMNMCYDLRTFCLTVLLYAVAAQPLSAEPNPETVLAGLDNPCGVAVQPGTGHIFVSESAAARVVRIINGLVEEVITGFPRDTYGEDPKYTVGPLGLVFQGQDTLLVGGGGLPEGEELLRVYAVPPAGSPAIAAEQMKHSLGPLPATEQMQGEGDFYGVAVTQAAVYVTCQGDDSKGWIAKAEIKGSSYGKLTRFIPTKQAVEVGAPAAVTISPTRGEVVVGQLGEMNRPGDSLLSFFHAKSGKLLLSLRTGLYDMTALAYSTKERDRLYALDFAWMEAAKRGLYRLDAVRKEGRQAVRPVLIARLDKPTAMAFAPDGTLYVTLLGATDEGAAKKTGSLVKFPPGL